jgi:hypothetical protein
MRCKVQKCGNKRIPLYGEDVGIRGLVICDAA